ncbi:B3 domain-containing protein At1g05920-like [Quercus lobata]|uniref:B3 domain-containing protein n=1 Tax=Quercus lobata TaxID=97700 RepID=A0A7N2L318_QUELO|nr:B3 domain-containing protein At1g05920-like [Quercus lobata]
MLTSHDFKGVYIDPSWSPFEWLLEVVSVADRKYHKEISMRNKSMRQFKTGLLGSERNSLNHTQFKKLKHHNKRTLSHSPSTSKNPIVIQQAGPDPPPDMPKEFKNIIMAKEFKNIIIAKNGSDVKLVIQKKLYKTDMLGRFARLSIPKGQMIAEFLSEEEQMSLQQKKEDGVHYKGMEVQLIQPSLKECSISLKKWQQGGNNSYMLSSPWNKIAENNGLEVGDIIQLWSFRVNHSPCLILIKL